MLATVWRRSPCPPKRSLALSAIAMTPTVLARLDRRMLADIGLTRSDVHDAFSTPLWEDPTTLLSERAIERRMHRAVIRTVQRKSVDNAFKQPATSRPRAARPSETQTADPSHRPPDPR